ncbi:MAG: hypothetical protein Q4P13_06555 [Psychrobacter sp.]|nr:hypothetical protein [Psychrobacter sp.]
MMDNDASTAFSARDLSQLISAVHYYKQHIGQQHSQRARQGWDTSEQHTRLEHLDQLEEQLYACLATNQQSQPKNIDNE